MNLEFSILAMYEMRLQKRRVDFYKGHCMLMWLVHYILSYFILYFKL